MAKEGHHQICNIGQFSPEEKSTSLINIGPIGPYSWREVLVFIISLGLGIFLLLLRNTSWPFLGLTIIGCAIAIFVVLTLERRRQKGKKAAREQQRQRESEFTNRWKSDSYNTLRDKVLERDGYKCRNCGEFAVELYHIKPRSEGGSDTPENLITLCYRCHDSEHPDAQQHGIEKRKNGKGKNRTQ